MILAADVGGTKTLVGLFTAERGRVRSVGERAYASQLWTRGGGQEQ